MLAEFPVLKLASNTQLMTIAGFGSVRRANDRLQRLVGAGILRRCFIGTVSGGKRAIYWLSLRGATLIGAKVPTINYAHNRLVTADQFITHQLQINDFYLSCKYGTLPAGVTLRRWLSFSSPLSESIRLIPDGYAEFHASQGIRAAFVEVDLGNESLRIIRQKTEFYLQLALSGEFARQFSQPQFRVLIIANSERRLSGIRHTIAALTDKIFWLTTTVLIAEQGLSAPIWLRPTGNKPLALFI